MKESETGIGWWLAAGALILVAAGCETLENPKPGPARDIPTMEEIREGMVSGKSAVEGITEVMTGVGEGAWSSEGEFTAAFTETAGRVEEVAGRVRSRLDLLTAFADDYLKRWEGKILDVRHPGVASGSEVRRNQIIEGLDQIREALDRASGSGEDFRPGLESVRTMIEADPDSFLGAAEFRQQADKLAVDSGRFSDGIGQVIDEIDRVMTRLFPEGPPKR